jgi:hypothetical protein
MLGQHPQMYSIPETSLFCAETVREWISLCRVAKFPMSHGLLRAVAQLIFGEQSESNVIQAWAWLRRRNRCTTGYIFELLAERVAPRLLVEKSPSIVYQAENLVRIREMFPNARYVHLVRHPRGHGESVMKHIRKAVEEDGTVPPWLLELASFPPANGRAGHSTAGLLDPQHGWLSLHTNIRDFLKTVPPEHTLQVRGEELLSSTDRTLRKILEWLSVRMDDEVLSEMKHPERWPYATFGPSNARFGTDQFFFEQPVLRPDRAEPLSLEGPLSWRVDASGFVPKVKKLAVEFGYD